MRTVTTGIHHIGPIHPKGRQSAMESRERIYPLPAEARSVPAARRHVRDTCADWGLKDSYDVELAASELLSNALQHAFDYGEFDLRITLDARWLRVGVRDRSPHRPAFAHADSHAENGRGSRICLAVADSVEIIADPGGKTVYALFDPNRLCP
jgi:anti-sigma regulatory factor (Ser/Thr protein kinase)